MTPVRLLRLGLFAAALAFTGAASWIHVKAALAQVLLERAWTRVRAGEVEAQPWPWADTWPVATLRAPAHGVDLVVLAGATGRTLAFGPGHVSGTAPPGAWGNCVLSGHRDTHFRFLEDVRLGETLLLTPADGDTRCYRVTARHVVYENDLWVLDDGDEPKLTLVTCYPFDAVRPGGPLRFVVQGTVSPCAREPEGR